MPLRICLLLLALAGCDSGTAAGDGCQRDQDCAAGSCIARACVILTNPLDASIPDLSGHD